MEEHGTGHLSLCPGDVRLKKDLKFLMNSHDPSSKGFGILIAFAVSHEFWWYCSVKLVKYLTVIIIIRWLFMANQGTQSYEHIVIDFLFASNCTF